MLRSDNRVSVAAVLRKMTTEVDDLSRNPATSALTRMLALLKNSNAISRESLDLNMVKSMSAKDHKVAASGPSPSSTSIWILTLGGGVSAHATKPGARTKLANYLVDFLIEQELPDFDCKRFVADDAYYHEIMDLASLHEPFISIQRVLVEYEEY